MTSTLKIYCTVEWLPTIPHFFLDQSHRVLFLFSQTHLSTDLNVLCCKL